MVDCGKKQVGCDFPAQALAGTRIMKNSFNDLPAYLAMLPVACLILNEDGVVAQANLAAGRLFGFENGRFPPRPFSDFLPTDQHATLSRLLQDTADSDTPASHELQITTADGRTVWVRAEASQIPEQTGCCLVLTDIDAYKRDVAKASQSKVRLNALIENAPDGISLLGADGRFIDVSPSARRILGYEPDAMLQHNPADYIHPDDLPQVVETIATLQEKPGSVGHATYRVRHADGAWRHIESTITNLLHEPAVNAFIFNYRDVSDRILVENRYQMLVEQNPAIIYLDQADEIASNNYMSPQIEKLLGHSPSAYQTDPNLWHEQVFPDDYDAASAGIAEVLRTGKSFVEYRMIHKDGRIVWVRDSSVLVRDEQGEPAFIQGFLEDITDIKAAENKLHETQTLLSSLLEHAPVSIFVDTVDGRLRLANKQWAEDVEIGREEAVGRPLAELYPPELAGRYLRENEEVMQTGVIANEAWANTPQGARCFYTVKFAVPEADGEITAVGGVALDVTARKRLEEELHERVKMAQFQATIGAALIETADLRPMLQKCAQAIVDAFDAAFARIWTLNDETQILELQASAGLYTHLDGEHSRIPVGHLKIGHIAQEKESHLSNNISQDPLIQDQEWVEQQGLVAFAGYPLLVENKLVGTLALFARHTFSEQQVQAVATIVSNIALAIERKWHEEALRRSQLLLQIAGKTARIGGWILDLETDRVTWSEEVRAIHEAPSNSPPLDEAINYYIPEHRPIIKAALEACIRNDTSYDKELQIITAKGNRRWVRAIGQAVRNKDGGITQIQGAFQDITEQKEIENSLTQSQRRFRQLANIMPLSVWMAEPDGTIDYANRFFIRYTGLDKARATPDGWTAVLHPDDIARTVTAWATSVQTGKPFSIEYRIRRHDGSYQWHLVRATPIRNEAGEIIKWYGTATDIHERRTLEEEMRRLANRLTATLESITDAFFTLDRDWRFTYINQEAVRILERKRGELIGKVVWEEFAPAVGTAFELEYRRAIRENSAVTFEEFYPPLNRWFEVNAYPSEEGLAVHFRDITRRKQSETQVQQQLDELRRWYRATLGREMRVLDLKQEINALLVQAGQPPRYRSAEPVKDPDNGPESG
jgi:PAS domain S-box-containing protein